MTDFEQYYQDQFTSQEMLLTHIHVLKDNGMMPTVGGWFARTANEAHCINVPKAYNLAKQEKSLVFSITMDMLHQAEVRSKEMAKDILLVQLLTLGKDLQLLGWLPKELLVFVVTCVIEKRVEKFIVPDEFHRNLFYVTPEDGFIFAEPVAIDLRMPASAYSGTLMAAPVADEYMDEYITKNKPYLLEDGASAIPSYSLAKARHAMSKLLPTVVAHMYAPPDDFVLQPYYFYPAAVHPTQSTKAAKYLARTFRGEEDLWNKINAAQEALCALKSDVIATHFRSLTLSDDVERERAEGGLAGWANGYDTQDGEFDDA